MTWMDSSGTWKLYHKHTNPIDKTIKEDHHLIHTKSWHKEVADETYGGNPDRNPWNLGHQPHFPFSNLWRRFWQPLKKLWSRIFSGPRSFALLLRRPQRFDDTFSNTLPVSSRSLPKVQLCIYVDRMFWNETIITLQRYVPYLFPSVNGTRCFCESSFGVCLLMLLESMECSSLNFILTLCFTNIYLSVKFTFYFYLLSYSILNLTANVLQIVPCC